MASFPRALLLSALWLPACATPNGESCELNSDCLRGTCVDGTCQKECADSALDCPIGYVCSDLGRCEYGGTGGAGSTTTTTSTSMAGSGGAGATTTTTTTTTTTSTGTSMGGMLAELTLCSADGDCDSGVCRAMTPNGQKRCTHACSSHSQCPAGSRCEDPGTGSVCVISDVGRGCTAAGQCNFACLTPINHCTSQCQSGADCPNGYGCMPVGSPSTNVCVRVEADCAADTSQCVAAAACDSSPNLIVSSCTIACTTAADCPQRAVPLAPWTCDGLCRRPGDVYGPLPGGETPAQWACNAQSTVVNVCNDAQHIEFSSFSIPNPPSVNCSSPTTTDGLGNDACVDSCRYQGGCAFGFACVAVGGVAGQRIGLCMPRGGGEVGTACSNDTQCAFGLCDSGKCARDCSKDGICPGTSTCTAGSAPNVEGLQYRVCK